VCTIGAKKEEQTSTTIRAILAVIDTKSYLDAQLSRQQIDVTAVHSYSSLQVILIAECSQHSYTLYSEQKF
jgi:hypothetical protein